MFTYRKFMIWVILDIILVKWKNSILQNYDLFLFCKSYFCGTEFLHFVTYRKIVIMYTDIVESFF